MSLHRGATEVCISIDSRPEYLPRLRTVIGCLAENMGMSTQEMQDTKLAITEACANAIRHGSPDGEQNAVVIKLVTSSRGFVAEVTDQGAGFDADTLVPNTILEKPGGLGIPLMRAMADRVEFLRNAKGMTVRLLKKVKGSVGRRRISLRRERR
ncbi:MAG: ATP-binding protein [Armatimonadota bacterium]|nr:ATP-binding protein [Armatimonadota bacterium]